MKNGKCPAGEYYCYTNKECKPIPKGFMVDPEGMLRKENGASTTKEEWSQKYKKSIDCDNPKGFSQKAHCQGRKKKMKSIKEEGLRDWFGKSKSKDGKKGWVNVVTGDSCASDKPGEGIPKCVSSAKRASMSKKERLAAAAAKRREDPGQQKKSGASKPTNVKTDRKTRKEDVELVDAYGETFATIQDIIKPEPMKETVCPRCGQNPCVCSETYDIESMTEAKDKKGKGSGTKDACYHKVKSRYSVWPSAYASGALVKCRKVGAANWGNKTKKEEFEFSPSQVMALEAAGLIQLNEKGQKCWKGYEKKGTKKMFGKTYNNCVKKEEFVAEEESDRRKDERQERGGVDGNTDYKRPAKNNTKKFGTGKTAMQKEMEKKHGKGKSAMEIVTAEIRAKHKKKEDKKENTNEERIRINQNGHTYAVMLNWRGKTYTVQIFFPELRKPTRQEVEDKIRKIYPDAKVTYFAPKEFDPADPTVMVGENVEVIDERKMTDGEMQKEKKLRKKYDKGDMKKSMKDQYGEEEGKKIYFAKIRKIAMEGKYSSGSVTYVRGTAPVRDPRTGESYPKETYKKKGMVKTAEEVVREGDGDPCWDTHKQVGMKKKGNKMVPNCVPKEEVIIEESKHEITVGNYTTKFFYMCGSAIKVMKQNADVDGAEELTRMQDVFYDMEMKAMNAGGASEEQKKKAQILYDKIIAKAKEVGIEDEVDKYMKLHLTSMTKGEPKLGFGRTDINEDLQLDEKIDGLVKKSEQTGVPYSILKKSYDRGMAAWKTGHRPGTTPQQWAFARVNSMLTGGKADPDLQKQAKKYKKKKKASKESVEEWFSSDETIQQYQERYGDEWLKKLNNTYEKMLSKLDEQSCCEDCENHFDHVIMEAEYQGKKVKLNDPIRTSENPNKKFKVYVKNEKGKVVVVRFGDPNMDINRDDPERRKSFRARHNCDDPGPKTKARYWSCFQWRAGAKVDN